MPDFDLRISNPWLDSEERDYRDSSDYRSANVLVVTFICNHCPYVVHVQPELVRLAADYLDRGVQVVGINSNDPKKYPSDSFENMASEAQRLGYPFPYLFDESQAVARRFGAVCTPDTYVFDSERLLRYHGRLDATRPGGPSPDGKEIRAALDALLSGELPSSDQKPSMGCSIKWRS